MILEENREYVLTALNMLQEAFSLGSREYMIQALFLLDDFDINPVTLDYYSEGILLSTAIVDPEEYFRKHIKALLYKGIDGSLESWEEIVEYSKKYLGRSVSYIVHNTTLYAQCFQAFMDEVHPIQGYWRIVATATLYHLDFMLICRTHHKRGWGVPMKFVPTGDIIADAKYCVTNCTDKLTIDQQLEAYCALHRIKQAKGLAVAEGALSLLIANAQEGLFEFVNGKVPLRDFLKDPVAAVQAAKECHDV